MSAEDLWTYFKHTLGRLTEQNIPKKAVQKEKKSSKWKTSDCAESLKIKEICLKKVQIK